MDNIQAYFTFFVAVLTLFGFSKITFSSKMAVLRNDVVLFDRIFGWIYGIIIIGLGLVFLIFGWQAYTDLLHQILSVVFFSLSIVIAGVVFWGMPKNYCVVYWDDQIMKVLNHVDGKYMLTSLNKGKDDFDIVFPVGEELATKNGVAFLTKASYKKLISGDKKIRESLKAKLQCSSKKLIE